MRIVVRSLVAVVLVVGLLVVWDRGGSEPGSVGPAHAVPVRYLPAEVPAGFELAWVDTREEPAGRPTTPEPWAAGATSAYVYGYRSETAELDVDVFPGYTLDVEAVARSWREHASADGVDVRVVSDAPGRKAVVSERPSAVLAVFEIEDAAVLVWGHGLGPDDTTVGYEVIDQLVRSFRVVDEPEWKTLVEAADVSSNAGPRGEGETLLAGEGWRLESLPYRPPRWTTQSALVLTVGGTSSLAGDEAPEHFADRAPLHDDVTVDVLTDGERTVAWGLAPATAVTVRLGFPERSVLATTVPFGRSSAFAVEVGNVADEPQEIVVRDRDGRVIHAFADQEPGDPPDCGTEDAVVTAQAPPAGASVPSGSCLGFRTG